MPSQSKRRSDHSACPGCETCDLAAELAKERRLCGLYEAEAARFNVQADRLRAENEALGRDYGTLRRLVRDIEKYALTPEPVLRSIEQALRAIAARETMSLHIEQCRECGAQIFYWSYTADNGDVNMARLESVPLVTPDAIDAAIKKDQARDA